MKKELTSNQKTIIRAIELSRLPYAQTRDILVNVHESAPSRSRKKKEIDELYKTYIENSKAYEAKKTEDVFYEFIGWKMYKEV